MDLTVDLFIARDRPETGVIDPWIQESIDNSFMAPERLPAVIMPSERFLMSAEEAIIVPPGYCGLVEVRSTWARLGLIIPPTIADPGFRGHLTMEVYNTNANPILIRPGDVMWHILFVESPFEPPYDGRYQDQPKGVAFPKAFKGW